MVLLFFSTKINFKFSKEIITLLSCKLLSFKKSLFLAACGPFSLFLNFISSNLQWSKNLLQDFIYTVCILYLYTNNLEPLHFWDKLSWVNHHRKNIFLALSVWPLSYPCRSKKLCFLSFIKNGVLLLSAPVYQLLLS